MGCLGFGAWAVQGKSLPVRALLRPVPEAWGRGSDGRSSDFTVEPWPHGRLASSFCKGR